MARYLSQKNCNLLLNMTANADSAKLFESLQAPRVPAGEPDQSYFWITHAPGFVKSLFAIRRHPFIPGLPVSARRGRAAL